MSYQAIIFDLDGTLLDTIGDIADAVNAVLEKHGYPTHSVTQYKMMVGLGLKQLIVDSLPESARVPEIIKQVAAEAGKEYDTRWKNKSRPYDGVVDMLQALKQKGVKLTVLSNKPHDFTTACVQALLPDVFDAVLGEQPPRPAKPAPDGALKIAEDLRLAPGKILYVGDSGTDMQTAKAAGMAAVGVLWGFRDEAELRGNGADRVIGQPLALLELFQ